MSELTLRDSRTGGTETGEDRLAGTPYRFLRRLGEGGMGEVIEAEHVALGHRIAIKLLRPEYVFRFEVKERMRVEAQACARIRHENLVPVTDFDETADGRVFIVMERLHGRTLAEELQARTFLPVAEAVDIARQALAGLSAAHVAALVHRDIKPDNLFLCEPSAGRRRVKVLDFGIAKILAHATGPLTPAPLAVPTADGMTVGTARWSSPEQSRGEPDIDARSDVYSMGWVLYMMLTGRPPFPHLKTFGELFAAHSGEVPAPPSVVAPQPIPPALDAIAMKAIAKNREERFPSADVFCAALNRIVCPSDAGESEGVAAGVPPSMERSSRGAVRAPHGPLPRSAPLEATVEEAPAMAPLLHERTVDISDLAMARPVIPWSPQLSRPSGPRARRLPVWFLAVVILGVGATIAAAALYALHAG